MLYCRVSGSVDAGLSDHDGSVPICDLGLLRPVPAAIRGVCDTCWCDVLPAATEMEVSFAVMEFQRF